MLISAAVAPPDPFSPNYGCFMADFGCQASQTVAQFMGSTIRNLGNFIATMIAGAFNTNIDQGSWEIAHSQFLFWIAVTAPVILIVALVQIGIAMILQDWARIGRTAAGAALAIPFSAICVWGMQKASGVTDAVTTSLTSTVQGGDLSQGLLRVVGLLDITKQAPNAVMHNAQFTQGGVIFTIASQGAQGPGSVGEYVLALLVVGLMMIASLFLFIAMSIREFGLLALAAMAPVGLMMIGQPKLTAWAQRWLNLSVGLLIAKPLAAGVVLLAVELTKASLSIGVILVAAGAVIAASFSPLWATKLVSFAGAEVGTALHHRFSVRDQFSRASTASAPVRTAARIVKVGR
ncbi:hypothetical protein [Leifsonia sp. 21MFCrub1.1]|uniref:hypothetical protein n=1 Tax=Leifsonia sp. 21MFCrub1.1 TaxID=1798223 RepID=UPI0008929D63|nr:hypothetical protein [Leifsonia sp. 21MFCrub1.1]SEB10262.1 hypothetical protein SAMN04515680_3276 [Leifsonia sp. 21MFCrub1.1]